MTSRHLFLHRFLQILPLLYNLSQLIDPLPPLQLQILNGSTSMPSMHAKQSTLCTNVHLFLQAYYVQRFLVQQASAFINARPFSYFIRTKLRSRLLFGLLKADFQTMPSQQAKNQFFSSLPSTFGLCLLIAYTIIIFLGNCEGVGESRLSFSLSSGQRI